MSLLQPFGPGKYVFKKGLIEQFGVYDIKTMVGQQGLCCLALTYLLV